MPGNERVILIIEDDHDVREGFTQLLQLNGYTVVGAADGLEGLEQLRNGPVPDLILLDLMMPRMDGRQFRSRQLQEPQWAGIPVIVISADPLVRSKAAAVGASAWLRKPVDVAELFRAVGQIC